jgi:O-antigen/teichoic acid export membrane protein
MLLLTGLLFSVVLFFLSEFIGGVLRNNELAVGLKYFSPIPMLLLPTMGIEGIFSAYKKTVYIAIYNVLTRILMLLFVTLPVVIIDGNYLYAIYGWVVASAISLGLAHFFKKIPFKGIEAINANLSYKEIFSYSIPLVTASIAGIAIHAADQYYISRFFGVKVFAEFSNGFSELPFVAMITGAASTVLMPVFSRMVHEEATASDIAVLWKNTLLKSATLIYPLVIFSMINAESFITVLYSSAYINSVIYFRIAMVLNFFNIIIFAPLILAMGKTKVYSGIHWLLAALSWILGYVIVIVFNSPVAVAILSVSLSITKVMVFMKYISVVIDIQLVELIPVKRIALLILHSVLVGSLLKVGVDHLFSHGTLIVSLAVNGISFCVVLLVTERFFCVNYLNVLQPIGRYLRKQVRA